MGDQGWHDYPMTKEEAMAFGHNSKLCGPGTKNTYRIAAMRTSITFQPCGVKSFNPNDIDNRYCGRCHRFVDDLHAPAGEGKNVPPDTKLDSTTGRG